MFNPWLCSIRHLQVKQNAKDKLKFLRINYLFERQAQEKAR